METKEPKKFDWRIVFAILLFGGFAIVISYKVGSVFVAKMHPVDITGQRFAATEKGVYAEGYVQYATPRVLAMRHSINFIPAGTEHYYFILDDEMESLIAIRADKDWGDKFNLGEAIDPAGVKISGYVKAMDYDVKKELSADVAELRGDDFALGYNPEIYIDLLSVRYAWLTILCVLGYVFAIGVFGCIGKTKKTPFGEVPSKAAELGEKMSEIKAIPIVAGVVFALDLILSLHVLEMML